LIFTAHLSIWANLWLQWGFGTVIGVDKRRRSIFFFAKSREFRLKVSVGNRAENFESRVLDV
jgi:hypothetical protein